MPKYFFHLHNDEVALDEEGQDFDSVADARADAIFNLRSLASEQVTQGRLNLDDRIEIADETGTVVDTVTVRDAVIVER